MSRELSMDQARKKAACTNCPILDNYHSTEQSDKKNVFYYYENVMEIELILIKSSSISYPIHNHVSVFTIGLILDGLIILKIENTANYYYENDVFVIPPYVPHEIIACGNYTLLNLCINKNKISSIPLLLIKQNLLSLFDVTIAQKGVSKKHTALLIESLHTIPQNSEYISNLEPKLQELV